MDSTETGQVQIRRANNEDVEGITGCVSAAYKHFVERIGQLPAPMLDDYRMVVSEHEVFVAESNQRIVGVLVLAQTPEGFLLDNIAVDPARRGEGIGRQLLGLAEARAKESGYDSIYLYTNEAMTENVNLYQKLGYEVYAHRVEKGLSRVYMRKRFSGAAV